MTDHNEAPSGQEVLETIKNEDVRMRPKWHFVLRGLLAGAGLFFAAVFLLYLVSFLAFEWRAAAFWSVPDSAFRHCAFIATFPWFPLLFIFACVALIEILVRRNPSVYRRPLVYSVAAIALLGLLGGLAIARTGFHRRFSRFAEDNRMPIAEPMYRFYPSRFRAPPGCAPVQPPVMAPFMR